MKSASVAGRLLLAALLGVSPAVHAKLRCLNSQAGELDLKAFMIDEDARVFLADARGAEHEGALTARSPLPGNRWRYHMEVAIPDNRAYAGQYGDMVELVAVPIGQGMSYRVFGAVYGNVDGRRRLFGLLQAADWRCVRDGYVLPSAPSPVSG